MAAYPTFHVPGPVEVGFGTLNYTSIGETKEGVILRFEDLWNPVMCDDYGDIPVDYIFAGKRIDVECLGMSVSDLLAADPYRSLLGKSEDVGSIYSGGSTTLYKLQLTERTATDKWIALCCHPFIESLQLRSAAELNVPLRFRILPDANQELFSTVPSYITTGTT